MLALLDLWLPILLSGVAVFVLSSILHMFLNMHSGDFKKLPGEESVLTEMRGQALAPGSYAFPCPASMKEMADPEMIKKYQLGPVGYLTVIPNGPPNMGKCLGQWFAYSLLVSLLVGYVAEFSLASGMGSSQLFRLTTTVAILAYTLGEMPNSIWKGVSWGITLKFIIDGILYGLGTGAIFTWLWPSS